MGIVSKLLKDIQIPEMVSIRQNFDGTHIETEKIPEVIAEQMGQEKITSRFHPGMRVAITAGSRGVANMSFYATYNHCNGNSCVPLFFSGAI